MSVLYFVDCRRYLATRYLYWWVWDDDARADIIRSRGACAAAVRQCFCSGGNIVIAIVLLHQASVVVVVIINR